MTETHRVERCFFVLFVFIGKCIMPIERKTISIDLLQPHKRNYRQHPDSQIDNLVKSLESFDGQVRSIVVRPTKDGTYTILAGHGITEAAKRAGLTELHADIVPAEWDDVKALAYIAADNQGGAEDDLTMLAELLQEVSNDSDIMLAALGSSSDALDTLLAQIANEALANSEPGDGGDEFDTTPPAEAVRCKAGDLWQLGRHRLLVGDCTDAGEVGRLMGGELAVLMTTDPPYGVDYGALVRSRAKQKAEGWDDIQNDALSDEALLSLLKKALSGAGAVIAFVWHPPGARRWLFWQALEFNEWSISQEIVWVKNALVLGRADYQWRHEPCLYARKTGAGRQEDRTQTTVWEENKTINSQHPTQKPLPLFERPIKNHSNVNDIVYDPFLGSGTTIIAAERTGRKCYGLEISPVYGDVILNRWEAETGQQAKLLERIENAR